MRLIDADELIKDIKKQCEEVCNEKKGSSWCENVCAINDIIDWIEEAPTVASDEDIKNFTLYNYPLKPGCNLTKTDDEKEISGLLEEGEE